MFKKIMFVFLFCIISGCAFKPDAIPKYTGQIKIYPSPKNIFIGSDAPITDHWISNSQVFIAGGNKASKWLFFLAGPLGSVAGLMIDQTFNSDGTTNNNETLSVKFDQALLEEIKRTNLETHNIDIVTSKKIADVIILPSARLIEGKNSMFHLEFRLTVRYKDPLSSSKDTRNYWFIDDTSIPIVGENSWAHNRAQKLTSIAKVAIEKLLKLTFKDISGEYDNPLEIKKTKALKTPFMRKNKRVAMLDSYQEYALISDMYKGKVVMSSKKIVAKKYLSDI